MDDERDLRAALGERAGDVLGPRGLAPGVVSGTTSTPYAAPSFCQRVPNSPCETTSALSPGERRFAKADSNAPVPDAVKTSTSFFVRNTSCSRSSTSRKTVLKSGERWWMTGSAIAASTSGGTGVGPGVKR